VLELGAGTGIVGMVASLLGMVDHLLLTVMWCADSKSCVVCRWSCRVVRSQGPTLCSRTATRRR
jgi:hypothetical protein